MNSNNITTILATDCGSTTTKAILIEKRGEEYRLVCRGEAPTTVEAPYEDVTRGVLNAIQEIEEIMGRKFLDGDTIIKPRKGDIGCDIYISTSSAGGGLQMMVTGVVKAMTAESAERAALGAGAIVMDTLASNDGRLPHQKIQRIRRMRPDMILMSGGVDGGTTKHVVEMAELLKAARPRPRLGIGYKLPVIYAGNKEAAAEVQHTLGEEVDLKTVANLRPVLERENLGPARDAIHDLFMDHVMAQAPGYKKLMEWTDAPIMPTPGAVGDIMQRVAKARDITVVGVDIGGATTDVFSIFRTLTGAEENSKFKAQNSSQTVFNRTVSANLGMSYSVMNVLAEAGIYNILRWVPFEIAESDLRDRIANKMIRPTTIPQTKEELQIEQAIAREALRLAFIQHKNFATSLKGVQQERDISDTFEQTGSGETVVKMMELDLMVGSGGVLSHAPRRSQAAHMMIDAFLPEGVTELAVDSIFMMPHLGVLASVHEAAAIQVFEKDCLIRLGTCIAPVGVGKEGRECLSIQIENPKSQIPNPSQTEENSKFEIRNSSQTLSVSFGELMLIPLAPGEEMRMKLKPARGFDVGAGPGKEREVTVHGGVVGVVIDTRGRPFDLSAKTADRVAKIQKWSRIQEHVGGEMEDHGVATVRK